MLSERSDHIPTVIYACQEPAKIGKRRPEKRDEASLGKEARKDKEMSPHTHTQKKTEYFPCWIESEGVESRIILIIFDERLKEMKPCFRIV
jgi:hypothetical protein